MLTIWLLFGSGVGWVLGCRYLLLLRYAQADHRERMAEISADRARLDDEVEQHRADRAARTRPDHASQAPEPDWPTSEFSGGLGADTSWSTTGRHALSTAASVGRRSLGRALPLGGPLHTQRGRSA